MENLVILMESRFWGRSRLSTEGGGSERIINRTSDTSLRSV